MLKQFDKQSISRLVNATIQFIKLSVAFSVVLFVGSFILTLLYGKSVIEGILFNFRHSIILGIFASFLVFLFSSKSFNPRGNKEGKNKSENKE